MGIYNSFSEILNRYLKQHDRSHSWLARRLGVAPATVSRWANGETRPDSPERVIAIADCLNVYDSRGRQSLLVAAGYGYSEQGGNSLAQADVQAQLAELLNIADALRIFFGKWLDSLGVGRGKEGRWEVRLVTFVQGFVAKLPPRRLWIVLLIVGLWWLTHWLVGPILHWPLDVREQQLAASAKFGVATLLIPFLVAALMRVDVENQGATHINESIILLLLKVAGGLAGFYILAFIIISITLFLFYLRGTGISETIVWLLVAFPLFASYVCAYVIAVKRHEMFARFQLHAVDRIALISFLVAGPATAAFLYLERDMLQNQNFGIILFVIFAGYVLWAYKQQYPSELSNFLLIFVWGMVLPCVTFFSPLWVEGEMSLNANLYDFIIFAIHVIGQGVLIATIYVRQHAKIFWPYLILIFALELMVILAFIQDTIAGIILLASFGILFGAVWILGKKYLSKYLGIHDSFWIMQIVFVASILAWGYGLLASWAIGVLYTLISIALVRFVWGSGNQPNTKNSV